MVRIAILFLVLTAGLVGCGPMAKTTSVNGDLPPELLTGASKLIVTDQGERVYTPYTLSGNSLSFYALRTELKEQNTIVDKDFSLSIQNASIRRLSQNDKPAILDPKKIELTIEFEDKGQKKHKLKFKSDLTSSGSTKTSGEMLSKNENKKTVFHTATANCLDADCQSIDIHLKQKKRKTVGSNSKNKPSESEVISATAIQYEFSQPEIKLLKSPEPKKFKDPGFLKIDGTAEPKKAQRHTFLVVDGAAFSKIELPGALSIETELLDTGIEKIQVSRLELFNQNRDNYSAQMVGNNPESGDTLFDIKSERSAETLSLIVKDTNKSTTKPAGNSSDPAPVDGTKLTDNQTLDSQALFAPSLDEDSEVLKTHQGLKKYDREPIVKCMAEKLFNKNATCDSAGFTTLFKLETLKKFLTYTRPIAPYIKLVSEKTNVTPEIGYILLLESEYSKNGEYNAKDIPFKYIKDKNGQRIKVLASTAYGPWQILDPTAFDISQRLRGNVKVVPKAGKIQSDVDDRSYLLNSTYMATLYLAELLAMFPLDPALAVYAYALGQGHAEEMVDGTETLTDRPVSLIDIVKFRMQITNNTKIGRRKRDKLRYALSFLTAHLIGQNLGKYGLTDIPEVKSQAFKSRLINPHSDSLKKIGLSKESITQLVK